jgi:hypothetical protein
MLGQNRPKTENSTGLVNSGTAFANLTIKHTTFVGVPLVLQTVIRDAGTGQFSRSFDKTAAKDSWMFFHHLQ